jgi:hypothetical protein
MKTKAKHGFRWGSLRFIGVWNLGYIAAWVASLAAGIAIVRGSVFEDINIHVFLTLVALGPILLQAIVQKWVTQRGLGINMRAWLWASLIGGGISAAIINALYLLTVQNPYIFSGNTGVYIFLALWLVPPALVQAWWLRKRVKSAWLWAGAAAANALLFTVPPQWELPFFEGMEYVFMALIALMMGVVSGGVMRFLWTQPQADATEKAKHAAQAFSAPERLALADKSDEAAAEARQWAAPLRRDTSAS